MPRKLYLYALVVVLIGLGFTYYRNSLIESGYNKAVSEYREAELAVVKKHNEEVSALLSKTQELQDAHKEKSNEVNLYRNKFSAASERLREQQADLDRRVEAASSASLRDYASAVTRNFAAARGHVERLGLEAASCSATAETLKEALDLTNGARPNAAY